VDDPARRRPLSAGSGTGPTDAPAGERDAGDPPIIPARLDATLVLLRHGESTFVAEGRFQGQAETPLSEAGRTQARLAAARLAAPHGAPSLPVPLGLPREIVHSPLRRTAETAEAVGRAIAAHITADPPATGPAPTAREAPTAGETPTVPPLRPDPGFLEIAQGAWEGLHHAEIIERWGDVLATWRRAPLEAWAPGGESLPLVQQRVRPALRRLLAGLADGRPPGTVDRDQVLGYRDPVADQPWSILVGHDGVFKIVLLTLFDLPLARFWTFSFALAGIGVVEFRGGRATLRAHNLTEHLAPLLDERSQAITEARQRSGAL
jgi:probable phosphoglycerate mutase